MSDLKLFNGLGNSYSVLSDFPFWFSVMQFRTQLEREFAEKTEKWCKNMSDKLYILRQHNDYGIIQIESALRMEVAKMEERAHFARVSSCSYEEAANLFLNESETADEKFILRKYETSFQEMLNPYKRFFNTVEKGQKAYKRSMVRLEKLVMEETASWFSKKKVKKARKTAKRNSDGYIQLLKEESNQGMNIASLSKEYEEIATEIAEKRVKSFVGCWSSCMSQLKDNSTGETRNMFKTEQKLLSQVDSEMLIKLLSELNKESLNIPTYQEFQGTFNVEELLGYLPVVDIMIPHIQIDGVKSDTRCNNASTKSSFTVESHSLDSYDVLHNPFYGIKDEGGKENKEENKPMTPTDSYDHLYNPFCLNDAHGDDQKEVEVNNPIRPADSYDRLYNPFCSNADEHDEEKKEVEENNPITPADSYDRLYNPFCSNVDEHDEEKKDMEVDSPITPTDNYDELYNPFCSNKHEHKEEKKEENKSLTPVDSCGEKRLKRSVKAVAINEHKKKGCLEMNIKPGDKVEQLTPPNCMGMVYGRRRSRITRRKKGGFIPSHCILPA